MLEPRPSGRAGGGLGDEHNPGGRGACFPLPTALGRPQGVCLLGSHWKSFSQKPVGPCVVVLGFFPVAGHPGSLSSLIWKAAASTYSYPMTAGPAPGAEDPMMPSPSHPVIFGTCPHQSTQPPSSKYPSPSPGYSQSSPCFPQVYPLSARLALPVIQHQMLNYDNPVKIVVLTNLLRVTAGQPWLHAFFLDLVT